MGFIKGGLLVFVTIVLFLAVFLGGTFAVLSLSLEYKNVQTELKGVMHEITDGKFNFVQENFNLTAEMNTVRNLMRQKCLQNETSYVFSSGGYVFTLPCDLVESNATTEEFIDAGIENIIYHVYYDTYDCNFLDCFNNKLPLFFVSEKAKNYWEGKFQVTLIAFVILVALVFLLTEQKQNTPIIIGSVFVVSALFISKLEAVPGFFVGENYSKLFGAFFNQTPIVFWTMLAVGIILIAAGILLRIFTSDFIKKKFSKEDVKSIVKEEMKKASKKTEEKEEKPQKKKKK